MTVAAPELVATMAGEPPAAARSPTGWPQVSLTLLKWSRSSTSSAVDDRRGRRAQHALRLRLRSRGGWRRRSTDRRARRRDASAPISSLAADRSRKASATARTSALEDRDRVERLRERHADRLAARASAMQDEREADADRNGAVNDEQSAAARRASEADRRRRATAPRRWQRRRSRPSARRRECASRRSSPKPAGGRRRARARAPSTTIAQFPLAAGEDARPCHAMPKARKRSALAMSMARRPGSGPATTSSAMPPSQSANASVHRPSAGTFAVLQPGQREKTGEPCKRREARSPRSSVQCREQRSPAFEAARTDDPRPAQATVRACRAARTQLTPPASSSPSSPAPSAKTASAGTENPRPSGRWRSKASSA